MSSRSLKVQVRPPSSLPHSLAPAATSCPAPLRSSRGVVQAIRTSRLGELSVPKMTKVSSSLVASCQVTQSVRGSALASSGAAGSVGGVGSVAGGGVVPPLASFPGSPLSLPQAVRTIMTAISIARSLVAYLFIVPIS